MVCGPDPLLALYAEHLLVKVLEPLQVNTVNNRGFGLR